MNTQLMVALFFNMAFMGILFWGFWFVVLHDDLSMIYVNIPKVKIFIKKDI